MFFLITIIGVPRRVNLWVRCFVEQVQENGSPSRWESVAFLPLPLQYWGDRRNAHNAATQIA